MSNATRRPHNNVPIITDRDELQAGQARAKGFQLLQPWVWLQRELLSLSLPTNVTTERTGNLRNCMKRQHTEENPKCATV